MDVTVPTLLHFHLTLLVSPKSHGKLAGKSHLFGENTSCDSTKAAKSLGKIKR